jgi:hypothetical protein
VTDANREPVMIGQGSRRRPKTRIVAEDAEGRVIDLHAMRTTLGTNLARSGVAPQIAQRIMRHGDYRTTLRHYTVLGLTDTAKAVADLPAIGATVTEAATGICDANPQQYHQQCAQQYGREGVRAAARPAQGRAAPRSARVGLAAVAPDPERLVVAGGHEPVLFRRAAGGASRANPPASRSGGPLRAQRSPGHSDHPAHAPIARFLDEE